MGYLPAVAGMLLVPTKGASAKIIPT